MMRRIHLLNRRRGWTYPDVIVAVGIMGVLVTLTTISLFRAQFSAYERSTVDVIASNVALQQTRAMTGDAAGTGTAGAYGIYFESNRYTLFKGVTYNASDPDNVVIDLNPTFTFSSIGFPSNQLVFNPGSGSVANYVNGQDTVTLENTGSGVTQTLHINSYGILDQIN